MNYVEGDENKQVIRDRCNFRDASKSIFPKCKNEKLECYICRYGDGVIYPKQERCPEFCSDED